MRATAEARLATAAIRVAAWGLLPLLLTSAGCGGDGVDPTGGMMPGPSVTLTEVQAGIFDQRCTIPGCHADPFAGGETWRHLGSLARARICSIRRSISSWVSTSFSTRSAATDAIHRW